MAGYHACLQRFYLLTGINQYIVIAGYKTLEVIKGNQHAYLHNTLIKKWDICAGNAILNALDGKMTTLEENFIDYGSPNQYKNDKGLLATLYNHQEYLDKLKSTLSTNKS